MQSKFSSIGMVALLIISAAQPVLSNAARPFHGAGGLIPLVETDWTHYHKYSEIVSMLLLLNDTYQDHVDVFSIGKSYQNREIYCIRLTNETDTRSKPKLLFVGYHHAREPITAELTLHFSFEAATGFGENGNITYILNNSEIFVVVALNVDGFELVEQNEWQRKNAHPFDEDGDGRFDEDPPDDEDGDGCIEALFQSWGMAGTLLRFEGVDEDGDGLPNEDWTGGVDLNRNYGYQWNATCQSGSPEVSAEDFRGPSPFSEPETQALRDFALANDFEYSMSFHSGEELILFPWGYTPERPSNAAEFLELAADLSQISGAKYEQGCDLYTTSGTFDDWMYGNRNTITLTCEIFENALAWQYEPGPTNDTYWQKGVFQAFNPSPANIMLVVKRWSPVFAYCAGRAIEHSYVHDVAVAGINASKQHVGKGMSTQVNVTVANIGQAIETLIVALKVGNQLVQAKTVTLVPNMSSEIEFDWNSSKWIFGNYTMRAEATRVRWETNIEDNELSDGWILVTLPGDVNGDNVVNATDVMKFEEAFGLSRTDAVWIPDVDIDNDGFANAKDAIFLGVHFDHFLSFRTMYYCGINDIGTTSAALWFSAPVPWYGIPFVPSVSFDVKKIELMTGGVEGNFVLQLRADSSGFPNDSLLGEANFSVGETLSWYGSDFSNSCELSANMAYWLVIRPYEDARMPTSTLGESLETWINYGSGWQKSISQKWMFRFFAEILEERTATP